MQSHRSDASESASRSANPSPPIGRVHGLGESHALRVDLEPVQLPWLADEVDTLRRCILGDLAGARGRHDDPTAEATDGPARDNVELDRRAYQLQVLGMIREQIPVRHPVVAACVANPWNRQSDLALELARITSSVTVVGPARGVLVVIRGAARNVTTALAEAIAGPEQGVPALGPRSYAAHWPEWGRVTGPVANGLRDLAAAAQAFTDTYVTAVAQQSYSFDPEHHPVYPDELW